MVDEIKVLELLASRIDVLPQWAIDLLRPWRKQWSSGEGKDWVVIPNDPDARDCPYCGRRPNGTHHKCTGLMHKEVPREKHKHDFTPVRINPMPPWYVIWHCDCGNVRTVPLRKEWEPNLNLPRTNQQGES
jgi:hypothetical protein